MTRERSRSTTYRYDLPSSTLVHSLVPDIARPSPSPAVGSLDQVVCTNLLASATLTLRDIARVLARVNGLAIHQPPREAVVESAIGGYALAYEWDEADVEILEGDLPPYSGPRDVWRTRSDDF